MQSFKRRLAMFGIGKGGTGNALSAGAVTLLAIVVVGGYIGLLLWLPSQLNVDEKAWTRITWIVKGFEAIVFAAAGFLFGRQVNRERAEKAEQRAEATTEDSKKAHAAATAFKDRLNNIAHQAQQGAAETFTDSPQSSAHLRAIAGMAAMENPSDWRP
jgi:uncharacterized protein HemX